MVPWNPAAKYPPAQTIRQDVRRTLSVWWPCCFPVGPPRRYSYPLSVFSTGLRYRRSARRLSTRVALSPVQHFNLSSHAVPSPCCPVCCERTSISFPPPKNSPTRHGGSNGARGLPAFALAE